jgi:hypothetical protein
MFQTMEEHRAWAAGRMRENEAMQRDADASARRRSLINVVEHVLRDGVRTFPDVFPPGFDAAALAPDVADLILAWG